MTIEIEMTRGARPSSQPALGGDRALEERLTGRITLTVSETAEILGISRTLAYELVQRDELPVLRLGKRVVVPVQALRKLLSGA
jgi:excisionase family DNA binding protein